MRETRPTSQSPVWAVERQTADLGLLPDRATAQVGSRLTSELLDGLEGGPACPAWIDDAYRKPGVAFPGRTPGRLNPLPVRTNRQIRTLSLAT
jgi:hypothetical protein